jgi:putative ABC transport system permease protein
VINYSMAQRTREIGLRIAVGADRPDLLWMIVKQGMRLAAIGIAIGTGAGLVLMRLAASLLYGVGPNDPVTFAAGALLLACVALVACWVPARRAMRLDPTSALRSE